MSVSLKTIFNPRPGWYKGDFHAHTTCSDGAFSPKGLRELATEHGLDFLAITDHNDVRAYDDFDGTLNRMVLPGVEVTLREGHYNVFGFEGNTAKAQEFFQSVIDLPPEIKYTLSREHAEIAALLKRIREAGLLIDIAHPLLWPWEWRDSQTPLAWVDCVELVNDPTYIGPPNATPNPKSYKSNFEANPATLRMWSDWLNAGFRIIAVGGTDFHSLQPSDDRNRLSRLNLPFTFVYAYELSGLAVLDGVRKGHVYVTMGPKIEFRAFMNGWGYMMGDVLGEIKDPLHLYCRVESCPAGAQVKLIHNGETIAETSVQDGKAGIDLRFTADAPPSGWYRLDVIGHDETIGHDGQLLAISNPIFMGPRCSPGAQTFGEFL